MTAVETLELAQRALLLTFYTALPPLGAAFIVGLAVSFIQARTGSDPTTSTVPKILAAGAALLIFGSWMAAVMSDFWLDLWQSLPEIIK